MSIPVVLVTNDPEEASELANRVVVMGDMSDPATGAK